MFSATAIPAALSADDEMRRPEESRAIDLFRALCDEVKFLWAVKDPLLVLTANGVAMTSLLVSLGDF
jgi:hypothetical protein